VMQVSADRQDKDEFLTTHEGEPEHSKNHQTRTSNLSKQESQKSRALNVTLSQTMPGIMGRTLLKAADT
jgi:hypothetical protein